MASLRHGTQTKHKSRSDDTPLPTPSYKYNSWMKDKHTIKFTPRDHHRSESQRRERDESPPPRGGELSDEEFDSEQKKLDRQWYGMDEGQEENPFEGATDEYMDKRQKELEKRSKKRMSARARQVTKVEIVFGINAFCDPNFWLDYVCHFDYVVTDGGQVL